MNRLEFIEKIFILYRLDPEKNRNLILAYDEALTTKKNIDWSKLYSWVIKNAEGGLPRPAFFINQFDYCISRDYSMANDNDGKRVLVMLDNGKSYDYELYNCSKSQDEIRQYFDNHFKKTDESGEHSRVKEVYFFDDYYELMRFRKYLKEQTA